MASLFKTWENAFIEKTLPPEWKTWGDCRAWAIANRYKIEYGYKGEFNPEGCLKAIPGYKEKPVEDKPMDIFKEPDATVGIDLVKDPDKTVVQTIKSDEPPQRGGTKNASKKTNTRSRSRNSV